MTIDPNSTLLYAPQARLVDLDTGAIVGATRAAANSSAMVAPDIVSAKVTLTNTGIGQLTVTLNNQRSMNDQPIWPPWKYNDFSKARQAAGSTDGLGSIVFGQLLRLDLRYGETRWVKMIVIQVNDLQFTFPASGGAQLQVIGEDVLCRAKSKPTEDKNYERKHEEDIASEVWAKVFEAAPSLPTFQILHGAREQEGRTQPLRTLRHTKTTTYFQFLQEMADRLDYEMFLQFKQELVDPPASARATEVASGPLQLGNELEFWFQPARSKLPPQGTVQDGLDPGTASDAPAYVTYELWWGRNLLEFSPKFKVFDMPTSAEARGTDHGRRRRQDVTLTAAEIADLQRAELPRSPEYTSQPITAIDARTSFFQDHGAGGQSNEGSQGSNLDRPRLKLKAAAQLMKKLREFAVADGQVIGLPRLRPGNHVHIVGLRPPFDGYYYVTKTVHSIDSSGYRTQFSLRRPGMLPPEDYLTKPAAEAARQAAARAAAARAAAARGGS